MSLGSVIVMEGMMLAKVALHTGVQNNEFIDSYFPHETMTVTLGTTKLTGLPKKALLKHWGHIDAKRFYMIFDMLYWDGVEGRCLYAWISQTLLIINDKAGI